jgi:hypothetical protein
MTTNSKRRFLAFCIPNLLHIVFFLLLALVTKNNSSDANFAVFALIIIVAFLCAVVLGADSFDRFWKAYLLVTATALFPYVTLILSQIVLNRTGGYFWLGVSVFFILSAIFSVIFIPVTFWGLSVSRHFENRVKN